MEQPVRSSTLFCVDWAGHRQHLSSLLQGVTGRPQRPALPARLDAAFQDMQGQHQQVENLHDFFDIIAPSPRIQYTLLESENETPHEWHEFHSNRWLSNITECAWGIIEYNLQDEIEVINVSKYSRVYFLHLT